MPFGRIRATSTSAPSCSRLNAIHSPSGDQVGHRSRLFVDVRRATPEPSAFIRKRSIWNPVRSLRKTIRSPSGDQLGIWSSSSLSVRRRTCVPSAHIV